MSRTRPRLGHGLRTLLRERDFRLLLGSQFLSQGADGMAQAAFATAIVLDPAAQGTVGRILAVFALTLLPYSLLAPFLGVFVDRWRRRAVLVWSNVARGALLASVPLWAGHLPGDAGLYAGALVLLGFGRLFLTTKSAVLPVVVHGRDLLRANAASGGGGMISALVGGIVGFGAVAAVEPVAVFAAAGLVYCAAALVAGRIARALAHGRVASESVPDAVARVARQLVGGMAEVWRRPPARLALAGIFILRVAVMVTAIAAILVIRQTYPEVGDRFGRISASALALGTSSAGALLGAGTAPRLGQRLRAPGLILLGFAVSGTGIAALGGIFDVRAVLALTAIGGYGAYIAKIAADATVQETMPDDLRGRAFSLYDILYNLASVVAASVLVASSNVAVRTVLAPAGVLTLALAAVLGAAMRRAGMLGGAPGAP